MPRPRRARAAGDEVELDVDVAGGRHDRVDRGVRQRRPAEVGVHDDSGGVEERPEGGAPGGQGRERRGHDVVRGDLTVRARAWAARTAALTVAAPCRVAAATRSGLRHQHVGARDRPPRIWLRQRHPTSSPAEIWRRRTGIEPARPRCSASPVLKTGGATRHPDTSAPTVRHAPSQAQGTAYTSTA